MSGLDSIQWEWVGAAGGLLCTAACGLVALITIGILVWRLTRARAPEEPPDLPEQGPETTRILTTVLGYRRTDSGNHTRERWGRPVTYARDTTNGARWSTPVDGYTLTIRERDGGPGGLKTGTAALDTRFRIESDMPGLPALLAEPELRDRLLALPLVDCSADGTRLVFADPKLMGHKRSCTPHDPESADGLAMQVRLHDGVGDVLVMLADRLG